MVEGHSSWTGPPRGEGRGQIAPGPQVPKGFIIPNASRSDGPHKVNQP